MKRYFLEWKLAVAQWRLERAMCARDDAAARLTAAEAQERRAWARCEFAGIRIVPAGRWGKCVAGD